jgi:negative regulator of flagellin synthesis FlgM
MQINGSSHVHGAHALQGPYAARSSAARAASASTGVSDTLDISAAAEAAMHASEGTEIRSDLVARVKSEIAAGTYDSADKFDAALERLLDDIA